MPRRPKTGNALADGPVRIKGASPGPASITASDWREQRECRAAMLSLAIAGVPKPTIRATIANQFGVTDDDEFDRLMRRALDDHQRERDELEPFNKVHAEQRILEGIAKAKASNQLNAAMKGEEVLARIQGTEKIRPNVDVELTVQANLLAVLNGLSEDDIRGLVADRARQLGVPNPLALSPTKPPQVVETTSDDSDDSDDEF